MPRQPISPSAREEICAMAVAGMKVDLISEETNVSPSTIYKILKEEGIQPAGTGFVLEPGQVADIRERYVETSEPVSDICQRYAISIDRFYKLVREHEIPLRKYQEKRIEGRKLREDIAVDLYEKGHPLWFIYKETGLYQPQLHQLLRSREVPLRKDNKVKAKEAMARKNIE